ncbi:hypothetical protein EOK75_16290 (plasmid) [Pseudorhodobacter turbinis]|uniref:Uncharacterized protein n=1 Tax=Pseudorhodobacter turbinis TaxID=2500533 RepID=A0A4P8EKA1_9RHOB|nr:hypothetical protein [Pseudorhodobacter turbinis]QCO57302.1 hypothetical protein EOK75_16290 [Pseudorhodobacter turbinis]
MSVHIAVYRGAEIEFLYKREPGRLKHGGNKVILAGEVASLSPDAIHVYEGPLTAVKRSLFDWASGAEVDFTVGNFHAT